MNLTSVQADRIEQILADDGKVVDHLETFITEIETKMNDWLDRFQWSKEVLLEKYKTNSDEGSALKSCPYDSGHCKIKEENWERHVERCRLKSLNLTKDDIVSVSFIRQGHFLIKF